MKRVDHQYCHTTGDVMVLSNFYDPDQFWFSFVNAVFPSPPRPYVKPEPKKSEPLLRYRRPISSQMMLAFAKRATKSHRKELANARHPTFDRTDAGALLTLRTTLKRDEGPAKDHAWCDANLRGIYVYDKRTVTFEIEDDYMLALLSGRFVK